MLCATEEMNMPIQQPHRKRRGATTVETAMVLGPLLMVMFGIFEYGFLLMNWNLLNNAAREGCRYAIVNNTNPAISTNVQTTVNTFMAGESQNFNAFTVTMSGTHQGASTPINNLVAGDLVTVTVTGQFRFLNIVPLAHLPATLPITSSVVMVCEGAT
jgi:Flp pilus assembly protein TadG